MSLKFSLLTVWLLSSNLFAQKGEVNIHFHKNIEKVIELKKEIYKDKNGIKIQIFSGSRYYADKIEKKFLREFPDYKTELVFETPNYKIWYGNFNTRIEAERELIKIKEKFKEAFYFKPKLSSSSSF